MKKVIKFSERFLVSLDSLLTVVMVLLDIFILIIIIGFVDVTIKSGDEIVVQILTLLILDLPLSIVFYKLSKALFPLLFQKDDKADTFIINREDFPNLYETIDSIRSMCKCPKIHVLALDYSCNAYIREGSRFYLSKWKKRYLVIGIPLLLLLNERELKSVIAHECGHLSKLHSRSTYRIYQKINDLKKQLEHLKKKGKRNSITSNLIKKYVILLNNIYFLLSKNHELEADIIAGKVISKQSLINSLIKMEFYDAIFNQYFWRNLTELNKKEEKIIENIYFLMEKAMKGNLEIPDEVYKHFLEQIRNYRSLPGSTHPSIAERAKSLGATIPTLDNEFNSDLISIFSTNYESALRTLLKNEANNLLHSMSIKWAQVYKNHWDEYYKYITDLNASLKEIDTIEKESELDIKRRLDRAFIVEELEGKDAAFKIFKEIEKIDTEHLGVKFHIARILLQNGQEEGIEIFKSIIEKDVQLIPNSCFHIVNFYLYNNNKDEAISYYNFAVDFMTTNSEAADERSTIYRSDEFLLNDLSSSTLDKIKNELRKYKEIKKAYVVTKKLNLTKDFPMYIIAIKYKKFCSRKKFKSIQNELIQTLHTVEILPWNFYTVPLTSKNINIEYSVDSIIGSRII